MIYIFSDTHIDDGTGAFTASGNASALSAFLDMVEANGGHLVANGDILDLWAWTEQEIMNGPHADLVKRLQEWDGLTYILGNHDLYPDRVRTLFPLADVRMSLQVADRLIFHGHQADPALDDAAKRWIVSEADRLVTELDNPVLNQISRWIQAPHGSRANDPLIENLEGSGKNFVLGHSHQAADLGWFVNDGCWCGPEAPHYAMIHETGEVNLVEWSGRDS